jgi:hypothetical protein
MITETLTKTEKLGNGLSVIMVCIPELYVWKISWWIEYYIVLTQYQTCNIKTYVRFIVAGEKHFPFKHSFATLNNFL